MSDKKILDKAPSKLVEVDVKYLPLEMIEENTWNPNVQDEKTYNSLLENIRDLGTVEPIMVTPKGNGKFVIISGAHRFRAFKELGADHAPVIIKDMSEETQKVQTVKMNVLHGKMDPEKFLGLFNEISETHGEEIAREMMAMHDEVEFKRLVKRVKKNLTPKMQKEFKKIEKDVKDVKTLTSVINELFAKYGSTKDLSFMTFTYEGKDAIWIKSVKSLYTTMKKITDYCDEEEIDINEVLLPLVEKWKRSK